MDSQNEWGYLIYIDNEGNINAKNEKTGDIDFKGNDAVSIIQKTIESDVGKIEIIDGTYSITRGIDLRPNLDIEFSPGTIFEVPNGYTGYVLGLSGQKSVATDRCFNIKIHGACHIIEHVTTATIYCSTTPQRLWTAIKLETSVSGIFFNTIKDLEIRDANIGVEFVSNNKGAWINGNYFQDLKMWGCNYFIDFKLLESYHSFSNNSFININCQSCKNTLYGVRNIQGNENLFMNVIVWDLPSYATSASISNVGSHTLIIGGLMTHSNFVDNGQNTIIIDYQGIYGNLYRNNGPNWLFKTINNYNSDFRIVPFDDSNIQSLSIWNNNMTERFTLQRDANQYRLISIRQTDTGNIKPIIIQSLDVPKSIRTEFVKFDIDNISKFKTPLSILDIWESRTYSSDYGGNFLNFIPPPVKGKGHFFFAMDKNVVNPGKRMYTSFDGINWNYIDYKL